MYGQHFLQHLKDDFFGMLNKLLNVSSMKAYLVA